MSQATTYSTLVTNLGSSNAELGINPSYDVGGRMKSCIDEMAFGTNNTTLDIKQLCVLPSGARITGLKLFNDRLDSDGSPLLTLDVGIANGPTQFVDGSTTYAANATISATVFESAGLATPVSSATLTTALNGTSLGTAVAVANRQKRVWDLCGLAADPKVMFTILVRVQHIAATSAAGNIAIQVDYVI